MSDPIALPEGYVAFGREGKNEVDVVSTTPHPGDPPKLRQGAFYGRGLAIWSINRVRPTDGRHEEVGYAIGKLDERYPESLLVGAIEVHLRAPSGDMVRVCALEHDRIVVFRPVVTMTLDAFAQGVIALYQDLLGRTPGPAEIQAHRGNPDGLEGVRATILGSAEYQAR